VHVSRPKSLGKRPTQHDGYVGVRPGPSPKIRSHLRCAPVFESGAKLSRPRRTRSRTPAEATHRSRGVGPSPFGLPRRAGTGLRSHQPPAGCDDASVSSKLRCSRRRPYATERWLVRWLWHDGYTSPHSRSSRIDPDRRPLTALRIVPHPWTAARKLYAAIGDRRKLGRAHACRSDTNQQLQACWTFQHPQVRRTVTDYPRCRFVVLSTRAPRREVPAEPYPT
jgi:hypothetical protein